MTAPSLCDSTNATDLAATIETPLDLIRERLTQANATLDLLFCLTSVEDGPSIEDLREGTLCNALDNCMRYIDEAIEATDRASVAAKLARRLPKANAEAPTVQ